MRVSSHDATDGSLHRGFQGCSARRLSGCRPCGGFPIALDVRAGSRSAGNGLQGVFGSDLCASALAPCQGSPTAMLGCVPLLVPSVLPSGCGSECERIPVVPLGLTSSCGSIVSALLSTGRDWLPSMREGEVGLIFCSCPNRVTAERKDTIFNKIADFLRKDWTCH